MKKIVAVILLSLAFSVSALGATKESDNANLNKSLSMVGGGVLGVVLASGAIGLVSAGSMLYEGSAFADAMESGAGLSVPLTFLSAILGAVFAQDLVLRNVEALFSSASPQ